MFREKKNRSSKRITRKDFKETFFFLKNEIWNKSREALANFCQEKPSRFIKRN